MSDIFVAAILDAIPEHTEPVAKGILAVPPHCTPELSQCVKTEITARKILVAPQNDTGPMHCPDMQDILVGSSLSINSQPPSASSVRTAHGLLPDPTPAMAHLQEELPVQDDRNADERVTYPRAPITRNILDTLKLQSELISCLQSHGYDAGTQDLPGTAIVVVIPAISGTSKLGDIVVILDWDTDDVTGQENVVTNKRLRASEEMLDLVDASGFDDPQHCANLINQSFFCKFNFYATIADLAQRAIASRTNGDDLSDCRPNIEEARQKKVTHPYVSAGMDKAAICTLANAWELADLSTLTVQPCLASRVETGIAIRPDDSKFVDHIEELSRPMFERSETVRCRMAHSDAIVETQRRLKPSSSVDVCRDPDRAYFDHRMYHPGAAFLWEQSRRTNGSIWIATLVLRALRH